MRLVDSHIYIHSFNISIILTVPHLFDIYKIGTSNINNNEDSRWAELIIFYMNLFE